MDDHLIPFGLSADFGTPTVRVRQIRKMTASYIRHQLYIGTKARAIGSEMEASDLADVSVSVIGGGMSVALAMLGIEASGPTIDAALRHWCELVEGGA